MRLRILLPILVLLLIPMPLALIFGMFVDYADAARHDAQRGQRERHPRGQSQSDFRY